MARYGRDVDRGRWTRGYDAGYGAGQGRGYGDRGAYERGFEIGPTWGGGSDVGLRSHDAGGPGFRGRPAGRPFRGHSGPNRGAREAFGGGYDRGFGAAGPGRGGGPAFRGYDRDVRGQDRISYGPGYGERWETTRPENIARRNFDRR